MTHDKLNIGMFVCSNGMGHIRRSIIIANTLAAEGHKVEIHLDEEKRHQFDSYKCKLFNYSCKRIVEQMLLQSNLCWFKACNKIVIINLS